MASGRVAGHGDLVDPLVNQSAIASLDVLNRSREAMLRSEPIVGYVRMHKCKMGVPRRVRLGTESQRMVARETEVVRGACIDEGEPAGGIPVPGLGRDLIAPRPPLRDVPP